MNPPLDFWRFSYTSKRNSAILSVDVGEFEGCLSFSWDRIPIGKLDYL